MKSEKRKHHLWLTDNFWLEMWLDLAQEQVSQHLFSLGLSRFSEIWHHITYRTLLPKTIILTSLLHVLQLHHVWFLWHFWWVLWNQALHFEHRLVFAALFVFSSPVHLKCSLLEVGGLAPISFYQWWTLWNQALINYRLIILTMASFFVGSAVGHSFRDTEV